MDAAVDLRVAAVVGIVEDQGAETVIDLTVEAEHPAVGQPHPLQVHGVGEHPRRSPRPRDELEATGLDVPPFAGNEHLEPVLGACRIPFPRIEHPNRRGGRIEHPLPDRPPVAGRPQPGLPVGSNPSIHRVLGQTDLA